MSVSSWTSLFFGYSFNEAHHTLECWSIQRICFSFLSIWVSFISQITCLDSPTKKRQLIMCLHPLTTKWQLTSVCSLKIHHVLAFFCRFFLSINHIWLIESEVLQCPYKLVLKRGLERDASLSIILLTTIVGWTSES